MNYDFIVTIKRKMGKTPMGVQMVFEGTQDLEEVFMPKIVAMLLKSWANTLEERQGIIECPMEIHRRKEREYEK